jgi:hypothetical protein
VSEPAQAGPVVASQDDVELHAGGAAVVEGTYEQQDVRMMQANPETLYKGHAAVVLSDGVRVFLYPPQEDEAIRDAAEIERFEHRTVRASGLLLDGNPGEGAVIDAPCLLDVETIELVDG